MESEEGAVKRQRLDEPTGEAHHDENLEEEDSDGLPQGDADYFEAYDDIHIHLLMLQDKSRVDAYAAAVEALKAHITGKIVMDVGAGSSVLSLLAAKLGGAKKVYAVEAAPGMAQVAREVVTQNRLDNIVEVVEGRVEEVNLPEKADVLISEWMGFYLLHESMLESVLHARDAWLRPGGIMMPSSAKIYASLVEAEEFRESLDGLADVHGLDFSMLKAHALNARCTKPQIEVVQEAQLLAEPVVVMDYPDFGTLSVTSLASMSNEVQFRVTRPGLAAAVALWFDVGFATPSADSSKACAVTLSTSPSTLPTHWKQTLVYFGAFVQVEEGSTLQARISLEQSEENTRHYNISVETL